MFCTNTGKSEGMSLGGPEGGPKGSSGGSFSKKNPEDVPLFFSLLD